MMLDVIALFVPMSVAVGALQSHRSTPCQSVRPSARLLGFGVMREPVASGAG
jgi:hypothetical protein